MLKTCRNHPFLLASAGLVVGLLAGVGIMLGVGEDDLPQFTFPETALRAVSTHGGESMAIATSAIDGEIEGLFALDYLTGNLQCFVYNPRSTNGIGGVFVANVNNDLGVEGKLPKYLMVTGQAQFPGRTGNARPASTIVYVMDAKTGNFAMYGLAWNATAARSGVVQNGTLVRLGLGKARNLAVREQ